MGRHRPIPDSMFTWKAHRNPLGNWIIVDQDGNDPFKHPDRVVRLRAVFLAQAAPDLLVATEELVRVVQYLSTGGHGFTPLLEFAALTINFARPPIEIVQQIEPHRHQGELDLEAA